MRAKTLVRIDRTNASIRACGYRTGDIVVVVKSIASTKLLIVSRKNGYNRITIPKTYVTVLDAPTAKVSVIKPKPKPKPKPIVERITNFRVDGYAIDFYLKGLNEPGLIGEPLVRFGCKRVTLRELEAFITLSEMATRNAFSCSYLFGTVHNSIQEFTFSRYGAVRQPAKRRFDFTVPLNKIKEIVAYLRKRVQKGS